MKYLTIICVILAILCVYLYTENRRLAKPCEYCNDYKLMLYHKNEVNEICNQRVIFLNNRVAELEGRRRDSFIGE